MSEHFVRRVDTLLSVPNTRRRLMTSGDKSAALVITRPPEIVTCVKISIPDDADVFMLFDSHPRPDHPDGPGFTFTTSIDVTARYLDNLLAIDESILSDHSLQWQTQLLANFSGLLFVARATRFDSNPSEAERAMIDSSLSVLALQAEVAELKFQNAALQSDLRDAELKFQNIALQSDLQAAELKAKAEEERRYSYRPPSSSKSSRKYSEPEWTPVSTRKKSRKKKSDSSFSSPADYRPSVFCAIRTASTHTHGLISRRSNSTHLLQRRTTAGHRMASTTTAQTRTTRRGASSTEESLCVPTASSDPSPRAR